MTHRTRSSHRLSREPIYPALHLLARMETAERLAELWENSYSENDDLERWEIPAMRLRYAESYRHHIGVHPLQRAALRSRLEKIAECRHANVQEVIEEVRQSVCITEQLSSFLSTNQEH